jgi:hypothetical protein
VGYAAACCQPRSLVAQSGILPALAEMLPVPPFESSLAGRQQHGRTAVALVPLTLAQVEFVQACIYAQQYRYGEDVVAAHWPRPTHSTVPLKWVLRYYYLRGTLHLGAGNWAMARRCYWTCLSVPADDVVSSIAVAAWKKLVLVQCRTMLLEPRNHRASHPLNLPKAVPLCFSRFLNDALSRTGGASGGGAATSSSSSTSAMAFFPGSSTATSSSSQMALDAAYSAAQEGGGRGGGLLGEEYPDLMHMVEAGSDNEGGPADPARRAEAAAEFGVRAYGDLAGAYANLDQALFQTKMVEHESIFRRDGNLGLVRQCFEQLLRRQVVFWSRVYSAISSTDLASAVKVPVDKLSAILLGLSNEVSWPIQVRDGIVHFPPVPKSATTTPLPSHEELIQLARLAQELDANVEASPKYLSLSKRLGPSLRTEARQASGPLGIEEMHVDQSI